MNILDNIDHIKKIDRSGFLSLIESLPGQLEESCNIIDGLEVKKIGKDFNNIVISGVGGSAIGAKLIQNFLKHKIRLPIYINQSHRLPYFADENTLLFSSSFSGNTEECISSFKEALNKRSHIISIGSGGALKELSEKNNCLYIGLPGGIPPRTGIGYMSIALLKILSKIGLIEDFDSDIKLARTSMDILRDREIGINVQTDKNKVKRLAEDFYSRFFVIYGSSNTTEAVSLRWRAQMAENAKMLTSSNVLPEMSHNEISGWLNPKDILKDFGVIFLRDRDDEEKIIRNIDISRKIIERTGAKVKIIEDDRDIPLLARLFSLVYTGDYLSFYLSILNGVDPTPIDAIEDIKRSRQV